MFDFFRSTRKGDAKFDGVQYYASHSALPAVPVKDEIAIVGTAGNAKWAVFDCPCRSGHVVQLNLQPSHRPRWRVSLNGGKPSLFPSVRLDAAPYCHYWIRSGDVLWTWDSGRPFAQRGDDLHST